MQENEKYGIELEAKTSLFKKGLQEAIKYTKAFGQGVKESFNEQVSKSMKSMSDFFREDFNLFDKDYSKRIDYIKDEMDAVADQINAIKEGGKEGNLSELEAEYDRLTKKLEFFTSKQKELNEELEETSDTSSKTSINLSSMFDKSISKIKRFSFYLLGARSVFSLFMKYQNIYYQYNEQMRYQSELSQNAIALSLAPAFEFLGNVITYASIGFAKFIELLTGVNVLSKVSTKGIRDYNKSLKETQTLVSGIDEITNLTNPQNLGLASQYQALADFQKKVAEVSKWFDENTWIKDLADGLKEVWKVLVEKVLPKVTEFIDSIGGAEGALILLGGIKVMSAISKLIGVAGVAGAAGTGLAGVAGLLTFIAGIGVIVITLKVKTEYDKNQEQRKEIASNYKSIYSDDIEYVQQYIDKLKTLDKNSKEYKDILKKINEFWYLISRAIQSGDEEVLKNRGDAEDLAKVLDDLTDSNTYTKTFKISEAIGLDQAEDMSKSFWQSLKEQFTDDDERATERRRENLAEFDQYNNELDNLAENINNINDIKMDDKKANITYEVSVDMKKANEAFSIFRNFNFNMREVLTDIFTSHATGLDYVPYDNYPAILHKGEAVVPAKYNPTIHSAGNDYTNSLLETLIVKVDDLGNRPNVFEIDGERFARTTYPLLQAESRNYVKNEGVSR